MTFVSLYGQSRVFYSMARDGFLPPLFAAVHPRFKTPHSGTIVTTAVAILLAAIFPLDILADLVSIGTLMAFVVVCVGILILRRTAPKARRPFRTPFVWFVAPAGAAVCGLMMYSPVRRHLDPPCDLDGARRGDLFGLWRAARTAVQMDGGQRGVTACFHPPLEGGSKNSSGAKAAARIFRGGVKATSIEE